MNALPDRCHACGEHNDGDLYRRYDSQCNDESDYFLCRECGTGTRLYHDSWAWFDRWTGDFLNTDSYPPAWDEMKSDEFKPIIVWWNT